MNCQSPAVYWPNIVRPRALRSWNVSQVAQRPTSCVFATTTRGLASVVRKIATGLPDWITSVSSPASFFRQSTIVWNESQSRAAWPVPP